jgi:hypothetical protein
MLDLFLILKFKCQKFSVYALYNVTYFKDDLQLNVGLLNITRTSRWFVLRINYTFPLTIWMCSICGYL